MVTFRRPPRPPPPKRPKGKNVIPFDVKRTRPPGVKSLGELKPDPDNLINLEQIKKAKELELRNAIQSEGMSPFPEGKGLSELGEEPPKKFKGVHEDIKDLSESMKKFNERHAPLLEREGLSGVKDRKATQDVIEIPAKTNTDKYIRERITNPDQPKLAGDELQKEIMKFTEGHSGNEDIISVLQRQIDDISDIGLPANREKLSQIYVRTVDKGGFKVLTINRKADDVIMGLVYPSLKGDTMIWQASPTMRRKSLVTWTPLGKTEGDYDLVTAQGKPITRRESGFQNVGEVTVTDPKKRGRSVMEGLRVILNYMEHEMQYYYDKSQGLNPTWTDPELNK